jgi:hypothetical protein
MMKSNEQVNTKRERQIKQTRRHLNEALLDILDKGDELTDAEVEQHVTVINQRHSAKMLGNALHVLKIDISNAHRQLEALIEYVDMTDIMDCRLLDTEERKTASFVDQTIDLYILQRETELIRTCLGQHGSQEIKRNLQKRLVPANVALRS